MSAQRANDISEEERTRRRTALDNLRRLREEIAAANPDMSDEDWDRLADEWAEDVNEGMRDIVRRSRGELTSTSR